MSINGGGEGNRVPPTEKELGEATPPGAHREPPPPKFLVNRGRAPWVWVEIDNQVFQIRFAGIRNRRDVEWYADQFRTALGKLRG